MGVVRRYEGDGDRLGEGHDLRRGILGRGLGGSVHVYAVK